MKIEVDEVLSRGGRRRLTRIERREGEILEIALFKSPAIIYGVDASRKIGEYAQSYGRKALLVTDTHLEDMGVLQGIQESLQSAHVDCTIYAEVTTEPVLEYVEKGLKIYTEAHCNFVISVGGGSPIDTGKGISILATNKGSMQDLEGINRIGKPGVPHFAVPTTAGTGSEASAATIITDTSRDVKMLIMSPHIVPTMAFVDPLLTLSMPQHITASTGLDALTHGIESYVSVKAHPITEALALDAIKLIAENLPQAWSDGTNIEARVHMMVAALEAGLAFSNSSVALVHGMARPLGAFFHVPHGIANAALLPTVVRFSIMGNPRKYADIAEAMREDISGLPLVDSAYLAAEAVKKLVDRVKIPSLGGLGIDRGRFDKVVEQMGKDALASGSPNNNPRKASLTEIVELYQKAY